MIQALGASTSAMVTMQRAGPPSSKEVFQRLDSDASGSVDSKELQQMLDELAKKVGATTSQSASDLMQKLDTDGDGAITEAEFAAGAPQGPQSGQGASRPTGPPPGPPPGGGPPSAEEAFGSLDTDSSGSLDKSELQKWSDEISSVSASDSSETADSLLSTLDTNGDGTVSIEEFAAAQPQDPSQGPPPGPPPGDSQGQATAWNAGSSLLSYLSSYGQSDSRYAATLNITA